MPNVARRLETTTRPYTCHTHTHTQAPKRMNATVRRRRLNFYRIYFVRLVILAVYLRFKLSLQTRLQRASMPGPKFSTRRKINFSGIFHPFCVLIIFLVLSTLSIFFNFTRSIVVCVKWVHTNTHNCTEFWFFEFSFSILFPFFFT